MSTCYICSYGELETVIRGIDKGVFDDNSGIFFLISSEKHVLWEPTRSASAGSP